MTSFVQSADGTPIAYEVQGTGPTIVLVDGAMCFRGVGPMRSLAAALGHALRVVVYDRRGRGESADTLPSGVDREIQDLAAIAEAVGEPLTLFGMSSGGALSLRAAAALDAITRVAVYEPPFMPEQAITGAVAYTTALADALACGDRGGAVEAFLLRVGTPPQAISGIRRSPAWAGMEKIAPTLAYDDAAMGDSRVPPMNGLSAEVLALAGSASPGFLQYGARAVAEVTGGRFELLTGETHDVSPATAAESLIRFLR
jgi:pimeloyl-ACP methyl ester carboxylesterase